MQHIKQQMNQKGERLTRQRREILSWLRSVKTHPSAEEVYQAVSLNIKNISRGTVYRNLNYLVDRGLARVVKNDDNKYRFDGNVTMHDHFICQSCGRIFDIHTTATHHRKKLSYGKVKEREVFYYGLCKKCY
ncbi:MAG: Fur family transcriptional regulator [Candidatus Komeilibacteria bacterium]